MDMHNVKTDGETLFYRDYFLREISIKFAVSPSQYYDHSSKSTQRCVHHEDYN